MFEHTSRYHALPTASLTLADGRVVAYKRRRFLPRGADMTALTEVEVGEGDRLDQLAARAFGDPEQYWRVCDANDAMNPAELVSEPGRSLVVPAPRAEAGR